jgi:hypothetical protein
VAVSYGIGVDVHGQAPTPRRLDLREEPRRPAPVVGAGELEVGDLHVHARRLRHRDGLADRLEDMIGLVADM